MIFFFFRKSMHRGGRKNCLKRAERVKIKFFVRESKM